LVKDYQINQEALSGLVFGKDVTLLRLGQHSGRKSFLFSVLQRA
jgi:hypothetical protein